MILCIGFPSMTLFTTHVSYGLTIVPKLFARKEVKSSKDNFEASTVSYSTLIASLYIVGTFFFPHVLQFFSI